MFIEVRQSYITALFTLRVCFLEIQCIPKVQPMCKSSKFIDVSKINHCEIETSLFEIYTSVPSHCCYSVHAHICACVCLCVCTTQLCKRHISIEPVCFCIVFFIFTRVLYNHMKKLASVITPNHKDLRIPKVRFLSEI